MCFPKTFRGQIWFDIPDEQYFFWLAYYLPEKFPKLSEEQKKLLQIWQILLQIDLD